MQTVIFLVTLLAVSHYSHATSLKSFAEVERSPFGKSLINLVDMNLKMKNSGDDIANLLATIKGDLEQAQKNDDAQYKIDSENAKSNIQNSQNQVKAFENGLKTSKNKLADETKRQEAKAAALKKSEADLKSNRDELKERTAQNKAAVETHEAKVHNLTEAISGCTRAIELIVTMSSTNAAGNTKTMFVQLNNKMDVVRQALSVNLPKFANKFSPILEALSQLNTQDLKPSEINVIVDLISKLRATLSEELRKSNSDEEARLKQFTDYHDRLTDEITQLTERIAKLAQILSNLKDSIERLRGKQAKMEDLLAGEIALLEQHKAKAKKIDDTYNSEKKLRLSELKIVDELISHFEKNISNLARETKSKSEDEDNNKL